MISNEILEFTVACNELKDAILRSKLKLEKFGDNSDLIDMVKKINRSAENECTKLYNLLSEYSNNIYYSFFLRTSLLNDLNNEINHDKPKLPFLIGLIENFIKSNKELTDFLEKSKKSGSIVDISSSIGMKFKSYSKETYPIFLKILERVSPSQKDNIKLLKGHMNDANTKLLGVYRSIDKYYSEKFEPNKLDILTIESEIKNIYFNKKNIEPVAVSGLIIAIISLAISIINFSVFIAADVSSYNKTKLEIYDLYEDMIISQPDLVFSYNLYEMTDKFFSVCSVIAGTYIKVTDELINDSENQLILLRKINNKIHDLSPANIKEINKNINELKQINSDYHKKTFVIKSVLDSKIQNEK